MTDVTFTSKDIARAGEYICSIALTICSQCPDDKSKRDLLAYVDRMKLYCHQLKITSSVRADSAIQTVELLGWIAHACQNSVGPESIWGFKQIVLNFESSHLMAIVTYKVCSFYA